jgi:hypothetical protein
MQIVPSRVPALLVLLLAGVVPACATDGSFDFKKVLAIVSPDYRAELAAQKDKADEKGKKEAEESKKAEAEVNEKVAAEQAAANAAAADRAAVDPDKAGKIFFTQQPTGKFIRGRGLEKTDGEVYIDEYELGQPLYARAFYFGYDENKAHISIRYTIDGEVFAEEDIREFWDTGVGKGFPSPGRGNAQSAGTSYHSTKNTAAIPVLSSPEIKWANEYSLHEEAFRMLLARLKDKVKVGKSLTLKVDVFQTKRFAGNDKETDGPVLASGEVKVKVSSNSAKLANALCRGGEPVMTDKKLLGEIADVFKFAYGPNVAKVHKVVVGDRDYEIYNDRRTGAIRGRFVRAAVIWEAKDGTTWTARHAYAFPYDGAGFSDKAKLDEASWNLPTASLCSSGS